MELSRNLNCCELFALCASTALPGRDPDCQCAQWAPPVHSVPCESVHSCASLSASCRDRTSLAHSLSSCSRADPCACASIISSRSVPAWAGFGSSQQWANAFQLQWVIFQEMGDEKVKGWGGKLETRVLLKPLLQNLGLHSCNKKPWVRRSLVGQIRTLRAPWWM